MFRLGVGAKPFDTDEAEGALASGSTISRFEHAVDGVLDAGACAMEPTTVIDLTPMGTGGDPEVLRQGQGELARLGL